MTIEKRLQGLKAKRPPISKKLLKKLAIAKIEILKAIIEEKK